MRTILGWVALLNALILCGLGSAVAAVTDYPFRLVTRAADEGQHVVAENKGPSPITVHVTLTGENFASDREWPMTAVIPPYATETLGRIYVNDRSAGGYNFLFRYSHHFGRLDATHDATAVYRLPFEDGRGYAVSQAHGAKLSSHNNRENLYAVDFAMPVGSAVTAARAGTVIDVTLRHREGGYHISFLDKANTIAIAHDDGTVAEYAHLSHGPELVKAGQRVAAGDLLGYSGNTGYSSGPHLHFIVSRPSVTDGKVVRVSVPVEFYSSDPAARFAAQTGATVWANYTPPTAARIETARFEQTSTATGLTSQNAVPEPSY